MAISSLSFSRGVKFMGLVPPHVSSAVQQVPRPSRPEPRLRPPSATMAAISAARNRAGEGRDKASDDDAVECARAGFDVRPLAPPRAPPANWAAAPRHRAPRRRSWRTRALPRPTALRSSAAPACFEPQLLGEDQPAVAPNPPAVPVSWRRCRLSPIARRPNTTVSTIIRLRLGRDLDLEPPLERARRRTGASPAAARPAARPAQARAGSRLGRRSVAAIDFLRRLRGRLDLGAFAELEAETIGVAARHAAAGVDDHRLARARRAGKAQRRPPVSNSR